jgi:hypothetical protein
VGGTAHWNGSFQPAPRFVNQAQGHEARGLVAVAAGVLLALWTRTDPLNQDIVVLRGGCDLFGSRRGSSANMDSRSQPRACGRRQHSRERDGGSAQPERRRGPRRR